MLSYTYLHDSDFKIFLTKFTFTMDKVQHLHYGQLHIFNVIRGIFFNHLN